MQISFILNMMISVILSAAYTDSFSRYCEECGKDNSHTTKRTCSTCQLVINSCRTCFRLNKACLNCVIKSQNVSNTKADEEEEEEEDMECSGLTSVEPENNQGTKRPFEDDSSDEQHKRTRCEQPMDD
ncbi:hypothetical protein ECANGB1_107 [Enterospora canceri]|uniref:Uncharacterized protein n=1 Tax=Enterospora canceri TaxID=1081671 RepID=A0A1Y1S5C1_9MICR|nr:hypothetical protein ECANGB1_107 [Enterospora canceri]